MKSKSNEEPPSDSAVDHDVSLDLRAAGLAGVLKTVKSLFTNGAYVFTVLYSTFDAAIVKGLIAFGAKFFQQQFGLTATMAGIAFGLSFYTVSQKKTVQNCFRQNVVKFPPTLIICGTRIARRIGLCEVHLFSTSPNSCQRLTVLNADVPNCYITL